MKDRIMGVANDADDDASPNVGDDLEEGNPGKKIFMDKVKESHLKESEKKRQLLNVMIKNMQGDEEEATAKTQELERLKLEFAERIEDKKLALEERKLDMMKEIEEKKGDRELELTRLRYQQDLEMEKLRQTNLEKMFQMFAAFQNNNNNK